MDYQFGDILDARQAPGSGFGHFILVVGETRRSGEVMYYVITSRVYTVFKDILIYFNDCLRRGDKEFLKVFNKEKAKQTITAHGRLSDAMFFDRDTNYASCLDVDSMVVINSDPLLIDKQALERMRIDRKVLIKNRLAKLDLLNLIHLVRNSNDISQDKKSQIGYNYNQLP